jgi:hypothetical protein
VTSGPHRLQPRAAAALPRGLALTDDLVRIAVIAGDLVNSRHPLSNQDLLRDPAALDYVVSDHPWPVPAATETDLEGARVLRARLDRIFRQGDLDVLDALLLEHPPVLALGAAVAGVAPELTVTTTRAGLVPLLAAQFALALSLLLAEPESGSLELCEGPDCDNVAVRRGTAAPACSDRCRSALVEAAGRPGRRPRSRTAPPSTRPTRR